MKRLTTEWLEKAEGDFVVAATLMRSRKSKVPDAICFHCQQCVEKLFKARLCEDGIDFPKSHDLVALLRLLLSKHPLLSALSKVAADLNAYAVNTRYPGDSASLSDAKKAFKDCGSIRKEVRSSFGL